MYIIFLIIFKYLVSYTQATFSQFAITVLDFKTIQSNVVTCDTIQENYSYKARHNKLNSYNAINYPVNQNKMALQATL